jgi:riboflavin kinase / FMN adenylyltransferase
MAIYNDILQLPHFKNAVLTIGTFDGVHKGHITILREVVKNALDHAGESIVITFEPHPRKLLFPDQPLKLITPLNQKLRLIEKTGIDHIIVVSFTKEFSELSAKEYIEGFLVRNFNPKTIIIGYDHHFGHDRSGNINLLREYQSEYGYEVVEIPAQIIEEAAVSSTKIRNFINSGHVKEAMQMMGRPYSLEGMVERGQQLGRTLGYPTANVKATDPDQLIPAIGIYAVRVNLHEHIHNGMLSIGFNPTVSSDKKLTIEVNIFDFSADIYGEVLEITFFERLRNEEKFSNLEELKEQLHLDKINSLKILGSL